jgi:hypothetical protein
MRHARSLVLALPFALALVACGGGESPPAQSPSSPASASGTGTRTKSSGGPVNDAPEFADQEKPGEHPPVTECDKTGKVQKHDLNSPDTTNAFVPCAKSGVSDYAGVLKIETIPEGVHVVINATDDNVNLLGADVKTRDAVIVYPRGKGSKAVEIPLMKTSNGYTGDKVILWDDLDKLTDDGTKLDIAVYDHDGKTGESAEEMHVSVAVSTGKSCEKAQDENPQTIDMGAQGKGAPDLTDEQLGAPMKTSTWFDQCGLPDSSNADICVAVKNGKPLGVSVGVTPANNRVAACIDRQARKLHFPSSNKLDVVHQKF